MKRLGQSAAAMTTGRSVRLFVVVALIALASIGAAGTARGAAVAAGPERAAVTAGDLGYPYPNAPDCDEQTGANCVGDQWGFVQGQCHSWVAYRLNELNATELHGATFDDQYRLTGTQQWDNPSNWLTAAAQAGVTVDTTPALGAVAWWSENGAHVAYVEAVNADGSIQISEMNTDFHNSFDLATLTRMGRWPDKFIHIADRPAASAPSTFSITVNGSTTSTVAYGAAVTFAESGIPSGARGSVVFGSSGHSNLCTIALPATKCVVPGRLAVGSYAPISASFHDTDGGFTDSTSTNTVALVVNRASAPFSIAVNGSASSVVGYGATVTLSESGIPSGATGSVVFGSSGHSNLCTIALPATSCVVPGPVAVGSYTPITASFTDTDGNFAGASATNSVSLVVNRASSPFSIAVNGSASSSVPLGASVTLSESGIAAAATGTVTFSTAGDASLCTITLPATSCVVAAPLPVGSYAPITAAFVDTDGSYGNATSTNSVALAVGAVVPGAPGAPHAALVTGVARVTWAAPSDDGGAAVSGYTVLVSPGGRRVSVAADATSATITGLKPGSYTFRVQAANVAGAGALSTVSNAVVVPKPRAGYWMLGAGGHVYAFGNAVHYGDAPGVAVAMASRRDGLGYWTVDARGAVHAFGSAAFHGGSPALRSGEAVATISATPSGQGYWLFTDQGRAFAYGDAHWFGDMAKVHLNGPVVASSATATGKGYYMVGSDGGVFSFGDAKFHGSTGGLHLNKPIVGISPTPDNRGYWLVASDGGVFAFGAPFRGSMGSAKLNRPVNGLVAFGNGYLMVASDGGIFDFSNKPFFGSLAGQGLSAPVIGITAFTTN